MTERLEIKLRKLVLTDVEVGRKVVDGKITEMSSYLLQDFDKLVEDLIKFIDENTKKT